MSILTSFGESQRQCYAVISMKSKIGMENLEFINVPT